MIKPILSLMLAALLAWCIFKPETAEDRAAKQVRQAEGRAIVACQSSIRNASKLPSKTKLRWESRAMTRENGEIFVEGTVGLTGFDALTPDTYTCLVSGGIVTMFDVK